jgi:hypothetical protein
MLLKIYLRSEYEINDLSGSISSRLQKCSTIASLKTAMHSYLLPTPDTMQYSVKYDFLYEHDRPIRATNDYIVPVNDNCRCHDAGLGWSISGKCGDWLSFEEWRTSDPNRPRLCAGQPGLCGTQLGQIWCRVGRRWYRLGPAGS